MSQVHDSISIRTQNPTVRAAIAADRARGEPTVNVNEMERWLSGLGGAALMVAGLKKGSLGGLAAAGLGVGLVYRGLTGHCSLYKRLGLNTADPKSDLKIGSDVLGSDVHHGILVVKSVTVNRPVNDVYNFWHNFANLPKFMHHLECVTVQSPQHSHWIARAPLGNTVEWDAEVIEDKSNELIAWRSLPGSEIHHAGTVRFRPAPLNRGTEVRVEFNYEPPAGRIAGAIARFFGEEPEIQIEDDLQRFKQVMETAEVTAVAEQANGH